MIKMIEYMELLSHLAQIMKTRTTIKTVMILKLMLLKRIMSGLC